MWHLRLDRNGDQRDRQRHAYETRLVEGHEGLREETVQEVNHRPRGRKRVEVVETWPLLFSIPRKKYNRLYERRFAIMTYKQYEASKELRLWIRQVIVPAIGVSAMLLANPDVRRIAAEKMEGVKQKIRARKIRVV